MVVSTQTFFIVTAATSILLSRKVIRGNVWKINLRVHKECRSDLKERTMPPNSKKYLSRCRSRWRVKAKMIPQKWMNIIAK